MSNQVSHSVGKIVHEILQNEIQFIKNKRNQLRQIGELPDKLMYQIFCDITDGQKLIEGPNLFTFLSYWGFKLKKADLNAIFKRCSQNTYFRISYDDFTALLGKSFQECLDERREENNQLHDIKMVP